MMWAWWRRRSTAARDPQRGAAMVLLQLVNLGLLEEMAKDAAVRPDPAAGIPALTRVDGWDEAAIGPNSVPRFAPNVELVRRDTTSAAAPSYLMVDEALKYVLDGEETRIWREVLRRVDGEQSLGDILTEVGVTLDEVRTEIEEALQFEILVLGA